MKEVLPILEGVSLSMEIPTKFILFFFKNRERTGNETPEAELRLLVHQSVAGGIIGRAGSKVKEIREVCCPILNTIIRYPLTFNL